MEGGSYAHKKEDENKTSNGSERATGMEGGSYAHKKEDENKTTNGSERATGMEGGSYAHKKDDNEANNDTKCDGVVNIACNMTLATKGKKSLIQTKLMNKIKDDNTTASDNSTASSANSKEVPAKNASKPADKDNNTASNSTDSSDTKCHEHQVDIT
jgi:hypothetical protein